MITAARDFDTAASTLDATARSLSGLQVVGHTLGQVPAADPFADTVTRRLANSGHAVQRASEDTADIAEGLVASADSYRRVEEVAQASAEQLGGLFGS